MMNAPGTLVDTGAEPNIFAAVSSSGNIPVHHAIHSPRGAVESQTNDTTPTTEAFQVVNEQPNTPRSEVSTRVFVINPESDQDRADWTSTPIGDALRNNNNTSETQCLHSETRPADGGQGLLLDIGSIGNLGGDEWSVDVATEAMKNGRTPTQVKRDRPLRVSGVGQGSETATHNVGLPMCFKKLSGEFRSGNYETPIVKHSGLPGLLGLTSLTKLRALIDLTTNQVHFLGPDQCDLKSVLPPGTESYQLEYAPSGHLLLPCNHFKEFDEEQKNGKLTLDDSTLTLVTRASPQQ
jgi:hypothetical protein